MLDSLSVLLTLRLRCISKSRSRRELKCSWLFMSFAGGADLFMYKRGNRSS